MSVICKLFSSHRLPSFCSGLPSAFPGLLLAYRSRLIEVWLRFAMMQCVRFDLVSQCGVRLLYAIHAVGLLCIEEGRIVQFKDLTSCFCGDDVPG